MSSPDPIEELQRLSRAFGREAAVTKLRLLDEVTHLRSISARRIRVLHDTLYFMRAYPDNAGVLAALVDAASGLKEAVDRLTGGDPAHDRLRDSGVPGSANSHPFSYMVLQRLSTLFPGCLRIDWDEIDDTSPLVGSLGLTVMPGEVQGLEDASISTEDWLRQSNPDPSKTDLEFVLQLFARSPLSLEQQIHVFESCEIPCLYSLTRPGTGRCEVGLTPERPHYQRRGLRKERFAIESSIRRRLHRFRTLSITHGRRLVDLSLAALCSRNLEIYPLSHANPADVILVECGRGLKVMLAGVLPEFRSPLEALSFFMILKNGVPIAYGPAGFFLGRCEMGINLFPEFRGGEIRQIYAQFMRSLYHLACVRYFYLTPYGMGEENEEALESGAFWFYRKLGFRAANPEVERLARAEEAIMRRRPAHRSSRRTLRRLSHTEAFLDLSAGDCPRFRFGAIGTALSRYIQDRHAGDRARARRSCERKIRGLLGIRDARKWTPTQRAALEVLAPILCMIADLPEWPVAERRALAALIKAKGARSELGYVAAIRRHSRLVRALRSIAEQAGGE